MARLRRDWHALGREQRIAALAAIGLFVTMLLPWYQQNAVVNSARAAPLQSRNLNAFQVFSFVEAAVLLVALAVGYVLYARVEGREFHLPGSDGTVVFAAGLWAAALLVLRLFDKPGISGHGVAGNVGVQWGIFFALVAAGGLAYAGWRMRAGERGVSHAHRRGGPRSGEPDAASREHRTLARDLAAAAQARASRHAGTEAEGVTKPSRPPYPPSPAEQMSFEDAPHVDAGEGG
jgi:hypothetical protein